MGSRLKLVFLKEMGKAGRWLKHFLPGGRRDRGKADKPTKEKRRWRFRRPGKEKTYGFVEPRVDTDKHAVAAFRMSGSKRTVVSIEDAAAIKIQAVFRSYLARKALCALRGLVKLQALVRGHLVRRQASHTLRCVQALVAAQHRARVARLRLLDKPAVHLTTPTTRRSEENVKIVEVDTSGEATPRTTASLRSSCYATPLCRTPSKNEMLLPYLVNDANARSLSFRYEFSFATASRQLHQRHDAGADHPLLVPSYMANTESSRAKARSQSAPRQRPSVSSAAEVQQGSSRRRASLERVQLCPSQAANAPGPSASSQDSECGSTSTAATTTYCWSMATDNT